MGEGLARDASTYGRVGCFPPNIVCVVGRLPSPRHAGRERMREGERVEVAGINASRATAHGTPSVLTGKAYPRLLKYGTMPSRGPW